MVRRFPNHNLRKSKYMVHKETSMTTLYNLKNQRKADSQAKAAFEEYQGNMRTRVDNQCRYAMMYCIFRQYLEHLLHHGSPTEAMRPIDVVLATIEQVREANPMFLSATDWSDLSIGLKKWGIYTSPTSEKIKRSFLVVLPELLKNDANLEQDAELVEATVAENNIQTADPTPAITLDQVQLDEKTRLIIDGYYNQVAEIVRSSASGDWFQTL